MLNSATVTKGKREERPYAQRGKRLSLGHRVYNMTRDKYGNNSCVYPPVLVCNNSGVFICEIVATYGMITTAVLYDMSGAFFMEFTATSDSIVVPQDRGAAWIGVLGKLLEPFTEVCGTYLEERAVGRFDDTSYLYTEYLLSITEVIPELSAFVQIMASMSSGLIIKKTDFCRRLFRLGTEIPEDDVFNKTREKMERMVKKMSWQSAGGTTAPKAAAQQQAVQEPKVQAQAPAAVVKPVAQVSNTASAVPKPVAAAPVKQEPVQEIKPEPKPEKKPEPVVKVAEPVKQEPVAAKAPAPEKETVKPAVKEKPVQEKKPEPVKEPDKPKERGVSVLESAVPGLAVYNNALEKLKGKGLFHILVFTNGDAFFSSCLEREVEILHDIGILESTECLDGGRYQKGKACVFGSVNASKALEAVEAGAFAFFCGNAPKEIKFKANVFDISGAGAAVAENWLTQAGMEIGCDMSKVLRNYPGWDKIPEDEFVNNTVMKHFTLNPDDMKIKENDFEWIKEWMPSSGSENDSIVIKSDTVSAPAKVPENKAQPISPAPMKVSSEPTWDEIEPDFDEPEAVVSVEEMIKSTVVEVPEPEQILPAEMEIHEEVHEEIQEEIPSEDDTLPADEPAEPIVTFDDEPEEPDFDEPDFDEPEQITEPPKAAPQAPVRPQAPVIQPQQAVVKPEVKPNAPAAPVVQPAVKKYKSPGSFKPKMGILNQALNKPGQQSPAPASNTSAEKKEPAEPPKTNGPITPQGVEPMPVKTEENKEVEALAPIEAYTGPVEIFSTKEELEQREENAKLFDAIMAEHEHVLERIQERGTAWHDRLRRGYEKAVSNNDYKFYGASFCNTEYGNGASDALVQQFYKSPLYLEVYNSEMRVRDKVAKIRPVKRGALCMNCRHKFEADITTAVGEATEVTCPSCGRSVRITLVCDPDGGENG